MSGIEVRTRRVYDVVDDHGSGPGEYRVLVDRLWPRGVTKERLALDGWDKDAAPSSQLRQAWHHDELDVDGFAHAYRRELDDSGAAAALLERAEADDATTITLLYAAKDPDRNHALVLRDALLDKD